MNLDTHDDLVRALLLGANPENRLLLHKVFRKTGWRLHEARSRKHFLQLLERHAVQVVIANGDTPASPWKLVLQDLQHMAIPPQLIVTSRLADNILWAEVLNWGGYDVLAEPLQSEEVERVVASARRHFNPPLAREARAKMAAAS